MAHARLLLVEDDAQARLALNVILSNAGYQVTAVSDGESAVEVLERRTFDVVLTDMRMRGVDGLGVLRAAMDHDSPPSVILLTGNGTLDTAIAALRTGAIDYLLKPCAPPALLQSVAKAVQRREASRQQVEAIRDLAEGVSQLQRQILSMSVVSIHAPDPPAKTPRVEETGELSVGRFPHEARYQGEPLHLTPIEHMILRCLVHARGEVVRYREIVHQTHGFTTSDAEAQRLLKSHIRNIRRKTSDALIVGVRNTGYRVQLPDHTPLDGGAQ